MKQYFMTLVALLLAVTAMAQHNGVFIDSFEIAPGTSVTVPVKFHVIEPTRGLQFCVSLPPRLRMVRHDLDEETADQYSLHPFGSRNDSVWTLGMYPFGRVCLPADTVMTVMQVTLKASPDFQGGDIRLWRQRGSRLDNSSIQLSDDTTAVRVKRDEMQTNSEEFFPKHTWD